MGLFWSKEEDARTEPNLDAGPRPPRDPLRDPLKVCFVGSPRIGRSTLIRVLSDRPFTELYDPTIASVYLNANQDVGGRRPLKLQMWDTAGRERFRSLSPIFYRNAEAVVVCFDLTSTESFTETTHWADEARKLSDKGCVLALVGLRRDLEDERRVSEEQGRALADFHGMRYAEVSSKTGEGVLELREALARDGYSRRAV